MILLENITLENMSNLSAFPEKNSRIRRRHKTFFKELFPSFLGLMALYLVNIQPTVIQNFIPPTKLSGSAVECEIEVFQGPPLKYDECTPKFKLVISEVISHFSATLTN